jgi:hypothetical protein
MHASKLKHLASFLLAGLLVVAPLLLGGRRPLPLLVIEIMGLCLLVVLTLMPHALAPLKRWPLVLLISIPILQLIPMPLALWKIMPGRADYALMIEGAAPGVMKALPLSMVPLSTVSSLAVMCVFLAVLLTVLSESESQLKKWVWIALGVGLFESILGLAQYGSGPSSLLRVGPGFGSISAVGTYTNRDHLAGLLEMLIPLSMAMMIASFRHDRAKDTLESFSHKLASLRFSGSFIYITVFILTTLAIIFTQSRAGIFVMLLGTFLSLLIFGRRLGGGRAFGIGATVLILLLILAVGVGLMPVINRFILEDPMQDLRWPMAEALLTHLPSFLPWGSGLGTFGEVFERFQTEALNGFYIDHAHNDIFEFLFEGGVLAGLVLVLFVWAYIKQWRRFWPQNRWHRHDYIKAGAGVSILLMALHSFIDFNLHVPANLIYFALVIGLFFHEEHLKPQAT